MYLFNLPEGATCFDQIKHKTNSHLQLPFFPSLSHFFPFIFKVLISLCSNILVSLYQSEFKIVWLFVGTVTRCTVTETTCSPSECHETMTFLQHCISYTSGSRPSATPQTSKQNRQFTQYWTSATSSAIISPSLLQVVQVRIQVLLLTKQSSKIQRCILVTAQSHSRTRHEHISDLPFFSYSPPQSHTFISASSKATCVS